MLWGASCERRAISAAPALLYQELSLAQRILRDVATDETATIQVDSRENFQKLQTFARQFVPRVEAKLVHYTGERPLFDLYGDRRQRSRRRSAVASSSSPAAT